MKDNKFKQAVAIHDYITIRDMLRIRLLSDHDVTGGAFSECWAECVKAGITQNIFQEHDGRDIPIEKTESNYNALIGQLATNFSEIRLNKILSLAKNIWASEQTVQTSQKTENIANSQKTSDSNEGVAREGRVISERILGEREIEMKSKNSHSSERRESFREKYESNGRKFEDRNQNMQAESERNDSGVGFAVAVAAVAVVAIVAGVIIFG